MTQIQIGSMTYSVPQSSGQQPMSSWSGVPQNAAPLSSYAAYGAANQQAVPAAQHQPQLQQHQQLQQQQIHQQQVLTVPAQSHVAAPDSASFAPLQGASHGAAVATAPLADVPGAGISSEQQSGLSGYVRAAAAPSAATGAEQVSHGTVLLTSRPVSSTDAIGTGKIVSFAPEPLQQASSAMPDIPGPANSGDSFKENMQGQGPPPQPGRKFKRDRSSRKNSFSLPPVPPKKQASAAVEFSPASSLEYALQGAASAPIPVPDPSSAQSFPAALAAANLRHSASAQDVAGTASSSQAAAAADGVSGEKSSRSSSADVIFCADGIDFNSRAWRMMSRKEKNRASAAASRARREAYTESLEVKVRKLQAERDWLQEQIEPGSVEQPAETSEEMQLPARAPIRHLSF